MANLGRFWPVVVVLLVWFCAVVCFNLFVADWLRQLGLSQSSINKLGFSITVATLLWGYFWWVIKMRGQR